MTKHTKENMSEEMREFYRSLLLKEVKDRIRMLKEYGMAERDIISALFHEKSLPRLTIDRRYRIYLGEEKTEVKMEPLVKSIYILFLNHPEGIKFKCLPDYRRELTEIYSKVRPWGLSDRAIRSIEDVTNPVLNSINEKCARIRKTFTTILDGSIAEHYYIKGVRGKAKRIDIPPELILWE